MCLASQVYSATGRSEEFGMNCLKMTWLSLVALVLGTACRSAETYGPPLGAPAAGTGVQGAAGGGAPGTMAVATLTGFMGGTVTGTATFAKAPTGTDVTVTVALANCVAGKAYPVHIHAGTSCADAMMQGDHWGPARGEGIPNVMCAATTGMSTLTRPATDPNLAWTIGGDVATNVVGHAFVVHAPDVPMNPPRIACGIIQ